jgi:hypothetical protein
MKRVSWLLNALAVMSLAMGTAATRSLHQTMPTRKGGIYNLPPPSFVQPAAIIPRECVKTPAEYAISFAKREPRCVDKNLIGRISQGFNPATTSTFPLDVSKRAANFFAGSDALEKFLLIGFPLSVGDFVDSLSDANFLGLQQISNGQAFLEAIGYSATEVDISQLYALNVFSRKTISKVISSPLNNNFTAFVAKIPPVRPTWDIVREFMEDTFQWQGLKISDAVLDVLDTKSFRDLTLCPAECAYSPVSFPSINSTKAVVRGIRTGPTTCTPPTEIASDWVQVNPTAVDQTSVFCSPMWQKYYTRYVDLFTQNSCERPRGTPAPILNANMARVGQTLAEDLAAAPDAEEAAIIFRAFLVQSCAGTFNPLFGGDGFTVTGFGGLLSATASEYISSPFFVTDIPASSWSVIPFCINGLNGGRPNGDGTGCALS